MQNEIETLTIITVVLNACDVIGSTIESVIDQSYPHIEFIVIDGGSTDGTLDLINRYRHAIDKLVVESDHGIYDAMNKGIEVSSGKWLCFLNAGDRFADSEIVEGLFRQTAILHNADIVYGDTLLDTSIDSGYKLSKAGEIERIFERNVFCHQSTIVRREILMRYGFDKKFQICADAKFFIKCYLDGLRFSYFPDLLVVYDASGVSSDARKRIIERWYITHDLGIDSKSLDAKYMYRLIFEADFGEDLKIATGGLTLLSRVKTKIIVVVRTLIAKYSERLLR